MSGTLAVIEPATGRELGPHALDAYTEVKSIYYAT